MINSILIKVNILFSEIKNIISVIYYSGNFINKLSVLLDITKVSLVVRAV
jgi:hypothetical protein